jgi:SAM-dependent methyltransferase
LKKLCEARAFGREPEMDAAGQAADIVKDLNLPPKSVILDVGCGAGHFIHSLARRGLDLDYRGLDHSPSYVEIGKKAYAELGLDPERLFRESVDDLEGFRADLVLFVNVLSFNPDFRRPLFRASETGAAYLVIRDNFSDKTTVRWEPDGFLDEGKNHLMGYWNEWSRTEMTDFLSSLGYSGFTFVTDRRTGGLPETVVGKPYRWEFLLAER